MNEYSLKSIAKKNVMSEALFVIFVAFSIATAINGSFLFSPSNILSLIEQRGYVYILGVGMLMCMLTGGNIDLSCGSFVCFMGAVAGVFSVIKHINTPLSLLLVILIGLVYGAVLGFMIAYLNIPPWIATLAGYLAFRGVGTQILTRVSSTMAISNFPESFKNLFSGTLFYGVGDIALGFGYLNIPCVVFGLLLSAAVIYINISSRSRKIKKGYQAEPKSYMIFKSIVEVAVIMVLTVMLALEGGIPVALLWIVAVLIIYGVITEKTTIGRHFKTVGGNAETARLSGIDNRLVMFVAYLNMALLTVLASLIVTMRFGSANSFAGQNFEMDAIAACIVGGVSAYGGSGSVIGMVVGATLINVIDLGLSLLGVDQDIIKIIKGLVLLAAVVFEIVSKKDKAVKK